MFSVLCSPSIDDGCEAMEGDLIMELDLNDETEEGLPIDEFLE